MKKSVMTCLLVLLLTVCVPVLKGSAQTAEYYQVDDMFDKDAVSVYMGSTVYIGEEWYSDEDYDFYYNDDYEIAWVMSSNKGVATVTLDDDEIRIKGISEGTAYIYAYDDDWDDYDWDDSYDEPEYAGAVGCIKVTVNKVPASKIKVTGVADKVYTGKALVQTETLKFGSKTLVRDTDYTVSYKNNKNVGTAAVTYALKGRYTGSIVKNYKIKPAISKTSVTVYAGGKTSLTAKSSAEVTWKSSASKIAKVSSKGTVTGVKAGKATVTAVSNGVSVTCKVTVKNAKIKLNKTSASVTAGKTLSLTVTPSVSVTWKSSDTKVAKVSSKGVITGVKAGKATVTATAAGGSKATCKVTVNDPGVKLSKSAVTLYIGKTHSLASGTTVTLKATTTPSGKTVKWKSSDSSVATVSEKGKVKAVRAGTATVTASFSYKGKTYKKTCKITVKTKDSITIHDVYWIEDSANGISPRVTVTNNTKKDIKYIDFTAIFYNAVGDRVYNDITGYSYRYLYINGPAYAGEKDTYYWDPVFYNNSVHAIRVKDVVIEYMDGSTESLSYNKLWKDSYYYHG